MAMNVMPSLGFQINMDKSIVSLLQQLEFLGVTQHDDLTAYSEAGSPQEVSQTTYEPRRTPQ